MKRITESQLRKLIESKVKRMLKENNSGKQQQMDSDWTDYEDANDKYQGEKFSPTLARHYNHNVEDGREEAEAYSEGLCEEIYKNVRKQLNESANNYQEAINYLTNAYRCVMQYSKQSIGNNGNNVFPSIAKQIGNIIGQINRLSDPWGSKGQENLRQTGWR